MQVVLYSREMVKALLTSTNHTRNITDYGPKFLTHFKTNPFWSDVFQVYKEFYDRIEVQQKFLLIKPIFLNNR